jgi:hypothetical protein
MRRIPLALLTACAAVSFAQPAFASTTIWTGTGSNDSISWGQLGPSFTTVTSGTGVTSGAGVNATVTDGLADMQRLDEGNGWFGSFAPGAQLLWSGEFAPDTITITFAQAVMAVGAQIQSNLLAPFTARITLNDGSFFDINGTPDQNEGNTNPFLGASSDSANISSITFSMVNSGDFGFAIGGLQLITAPTPEPSTWAMMIIGFGIAGAAMRRRKRASGVALA